MDMNWAWVFKSGVAVIFSALVLTSLLWDIYFIFKT